MKAKKRSFRSGEPPENRPGGRVRRPEGPRTSPLSFRRAAATLVAIGIVAWWFHWVRASAIASEVEMASLPPGAEVSAINDGLIGMDRLVSLDFRSTEATDALKYLAAKGELNIAISKSVTGRVNLYLTDVPIRDVFDLILRSNQLAYEKKGTVFNIMTEDEYRSFYGKKFSDFREVKTFRLQYAIPQQAFNLLDTLKSEVGRILIDEDSGTVMVIDTPANLREMEEAMTVLEQGGLTKVVDLKYAKAEDIEERLQDQLEINKLGFVKADERTNQVMVKAFPERMRELEDIIQALDRKTREVLIDAKIVKVTYLDRMDSGVNWDQVFSNVKFHGIDPVGDFRTAVSGTAPTEVPAVAHMKIPEIKVNSGLGDSIKMGDLLFGTVARDGYELFRYLETIGRTQVVSNPRLLVTEDQKARIHVGTREAYVTSTTTTGQSTETTAEAIEFIDVGILLEVTPRINQEGFVTMLIKPEVSDKVDTLITKQGTEVPIIGTATAETTVMVQDGMTLVIGGLRKNEKKSTDKGVPYLNQIPLIGPILFRQRARDDTLTEHVVFITPHIVQGDELVTADEQARTLRDFRDYPPIR